MGHFLCHIGKGKIDGLERQSFLLHPGEVNQVLGQLGEPLGLAADILDPLIFSTFHFCQVRIGADDGQRGFQFVACVGDELFLLFIAFGHRPDNALGEQKQQNQHRSQPAQDDGLNAAGGADSSGFGVRQQDRFASSASSDSFILINGGTFTITSQGDCIDSNGDLTINGGTLDLTCNGSGNTALDTDGSYTNNGGTVTTNDGSEENSGAMGGGQGGMGGKMGGGRQNSTTPPSSTAP